MSKHLPTSGQIIKLLLSCKQLSISELQYHLDVQKSEELNFKRILKKLANRKEIMISHDHIVSLTKPIVLCIFHANKDTRGGIAIEPMTKEAITIYAGNENYALDGDEVAVLHESIDKFGKPVGIIIEIVKRKVIHLIGRIEQYKEKYYLIMDNPKLGHYPVIVTEINSKIDLEQIYDTVILSYPSPEQAYFKVRLVKALGKIGNDAVFIDRVLIEANVPLEFSPETEKLVAKIPDKIFPRELTGREDLRKFPFVTIDGEDAKDFDDAVYCEKNPDGSFILSVAIADVAHYVKHNSTLDQDAFARSTSIYFPTRVVPMLPEKLSNGLCSLIPNVDRLVMVCHMQISSDGEIKEYGIDNAVIHSHYRLTYNQVQKYINKEELIPDDIKDSITNLYEVYQGLSKARHKRGAIDFETSEPYFEFDIYGNVSNIKVRQRLDSHKLIEECMLAANVSVADFLTKSGHATLYRNHDRPNEKKFSALKSYLDSIAIPFDVKQENVSPKDYANLVEQIKKLPNTGVVQQIILRSMQLAEYAPKNIGHFGLAYSQYLHFTSPIRRYPDLLVHRACKAILDNKNYDYIHSIEVMGEQTSFCERRAEELERKVDSYFKCRFAQNHIGQEFHGVITSVVSFGLFVNIPELLIDGLIHVAALGSDYFIFDDKKQVLVGKNSGFRYITGQDLQVVIANVDMDKLFIDLELSDMNDFAK